MGVSGQNLAEVLAFHAPAGDDPKRYERLRAGARVFAEAILEETPACADQQAALRKVREALMTANAAVALGGMI